MTRTTLTAILLTGTLLLAGCGGNSQQQQRQALDAYIRQACIHDQAGVRSLDNLTVNECVRSLDGTPYTRTP